VTLEDINALFVEQFEDMGPNPVVESIDGNQLVVRMPYESRHLRPGGTLSGPVMMMLADAVAYSAILATIENASMSVTSSLNINFLRRPQPVDLLAYGEVLRMGRRLAVVSVRICSEGVEEPVAFATVNYALYSSNREGS
jgi:uncharacterized protein (TIGR00369 family)